jgi:CzcA family heavy metal efflux pump
MIDFLLRLSLRRRWLVLAAAALVSILGAVRAARMPIDVFPDLTAPRVTVVTESTGMAPEEVERLVTFPIEAAVNGVAGVRRVRSASAPGISIVWVEFDWDTGGSVARQRVTERLQGVSGVLPPEAEAPILAPPSSVMGEIAFVALTSEADDPLELRRVGEVEVRRRLLAVRGVAQVVALGGLERQYQVIADPERLQRYDLTLDDLVRALDQGNQNVPGGYVVGQGQEFVVRLLGRSHGEEDLEDITVALRADHPIRVRDVADVRLGAALPRGTASYNGRPAIVLSVVKQPGADTLEVTARVDAALDLMAPSIAQRRMTIHRDLFRQADFIETAVANLMTVLRDGALLVIGVLLVFLWSLRPTIISAVALPLSLLVSALVLDALGMSLDTMTLGGLAIAIGELVDDAIVDVENVMRRLRDRARLAEPDRKPVLVTVLAASREIRSSIVSATAILMVVFLPLLFLEDVEGRLLRPLGIAYLVAIASSLLVAVTVTPAMCAVLLPGAVSASGKEPPVMHRIVRLYEPALRFGLRHPRAVIAGAIVVIGLGGLGLAFTGRAFLPAFNEGSLTIAAVTLPGTSLEQSDALGALAERALLEDPAVVSTARRTGRAERDEHVQGVEAAEIDVRLRADRRTKDELLADIRERLAAVPGMQFTIGQPISHRIDHMLSGQRAALSIKVIGESLHELRVYAERIRAVVAGVPGLVDLSVEQAVNVPQVVVRIDRHQAAQYGFSPGRAAQVAGTALWGTEAGRIYEHGTVTDVVVRYADDVRESLQAVQNTRVPTPSGAVVPLSAFADVTADRGPNYILRENVERRIVVTANVANRDLRSVYEDVRARVKERVELPATLRVEYAGQFEREEAAGLQLLLLGCVAILGIVLILFATLRSARRTAIVLVNLPLALVGGVVGVFLGGGVLSVASIIGFITLFGIATRNGILLATRTRDLELAGMERAAAVAQSARERLAPILMTAVTAGLGLLPLALALGEPGSEIQAPMALVILTGLATSTVLNMIVVPALLSRWGGVTKPVEDVLDER